MMADWQRTAFACAISGCTRYGAFIFFLPARNTQFSGAIERRYCFRHRGNGEAWFQSLAAGGAAQLPRKGQLPLFGLGGTVE